MKKSNLKKTHTKVNRKKNVIKNLKEIIVSLIFVCIVILFFGIAGAIENDEFIYSSSSSLSNEDATSSKEDFLCEEASSNEDISSSEYESSETDASISKNSNKVSITKKIQKKSSKKEITSKKSNSSNVSKKRVQVSDYEFNWIVQAVQHEVGNSASYYPSYNFDTIQKYMASVIINRIGKNGFADTASGVLSQSGQFMSVSELAAFDPYDRQTMKNVQAVLNGDFSSSNVVFEMSFESQDASYNQSVMEEQVGSVIPIYSAISADGRYLMFAAKA